LNKREVILLLIIIAMFVLVMLFMAKTNSIGQRLSELEFEQQRSYNLSVSVMCIPTLPVRTNAINPTNADIRQDYLQANYKPELPIDSEHIACPQICVTQWLEDAITVRDTLDCIEGYMKNEELKMQSQEP
jgi:hypothetical protein